MPRCKECLHYEVCAKEGRLVQVDEHTWDEYNKLDDVEQFCTNYFTADVVPKSECEKLVQVGTRLGQENETLKDNNEHLAVILEETKAEVERLQNELVIWKQNRFNLFQRLECYETARQKVASEIFAEIETCMKDFEDDDDGYLLKKCEFEFFMRELKKKYAEIEVEN